jgi:predicted nucleic acid-binding protein
LNKLEEFKNEEIVPTALNLEEFLYGLYNRKNKSEYSHPIFQLTILPFTSSEAVKAAVLENTLETLSKQKPQEDILIVSVVLTNNAQIITLNISQFEDIEGLSLIQV